MLRDTFGTNTQNKNDDVSIADAAGGRGGVTSSGSSGGSGDGEDNRVGQQDSRSAEVIKAEKDAIKQTLKL